MVLVSVTGKKGKKKKKRRKKKKAKGENMLIYTILSCM
jgi:hypothetical protein